MAAITENTRFDYYNALEARAYKVRQIFKMAQHPTTIFITITGENPGFRVGQTISFRNSQTAFTGTVWYIWKGPTGFNLYVKPPNYSSIVPALGGEVIVGEFPAKTTSVTKAITTAPVTTSLAKTTIADPFGVGTGSPKEITEKLPGPDPVAAQRASSLPAFVNAKNMAIALVVLVAGSFLFKRKK